MPLLPKSFSIRSWLFILVLACWLPLGSLLFRHFLVNDQNAARMAATAQMRELAHTTASTLALTLHDQETTLRLVAATFGTHGRAQPERFLSAQFMDLNPLVQNFSVYDQGGNSRYSFLPEAQPTGRPLAWVQAAGAAEGFRAHSAFQAGPGAPWVSNLSFPTSDRAGRRTGFVNASIDLLRLNTRLLGQVPATLTVAVLDREGNFLLRSLEPEKWIGRPGPKSLTDLSAARSDGYLKLQSVDGVEKLLAYVTLPDTGWRVVAGVPEDLAMAGYNTFRRQTLLLGLLLVLGSLALAWRIATLIATPITALAQASRQIAEAEQPVTVVPSGPAEIQAVASQFNRMVVAQHNSLASLAESEARWQFALEGSGDGVWDWNIVTGQVFYSARCNQILGFAEGGLVGTIAEWTARTHPDDYDSVAALGRLHLDRKADSYAAGFRVRCKNNAYKWIYARGLVVERGPDGLALRMVGTITDISRTKQQDDDMRTAAIAFESQMPLYILNPECRFERTNRAFTVLTGLALPALQGQALDALLTRQSVEPEAVIGFWKGVVQNGEAQLEFAAQAGSGALLRLQTHLSVVKNDKAEVVAYVGTLVDITESRRLEAQRNAMLEAQKTALVREVHHRVKNNLQGMIGMLRAFGRNHPETMEPLSEVIGQVQSISVIHGLQGQTSLAQVRLCELTESIAHSIATARGADIRFHRPVPWRAHIIAAREAVPIALVLNELILNAVKHGRADQGPVQVSMEEGAQAGAVRVRISNHGSWKPEGKSSQVGLQLVETLLPHQGATLSRVLGPDRIDTLVELEPPVISPAQPDLPT